MVDGRTPGISETEEAGDLVEGLSCGIVDGLPEQAVVPVVDHLDQHRVPARHQEHHQRQFERLIFEERCVEMGLHVVDPDERDVPCHGQGLGRGDTHEQRSDQPGPDGAGDGVDPFGLDARLDDRPGDDRVEQVEMGTAGNLGHHTAVLRVQVDLRRHHAGQHVVTAHHQRRGGLVAAGLDAQDDGRVGDGHDGNAPGMDAGLNDDRRSLNSAAPMSWHHMTIASSVFS